MSKVQKNCSIHLLIISRKLRISQILFVLLSQYSENILNSQYSTMEQSIENLYKLDGRVPVGKALPFGLQHVLAMFVSNIAPIMILAGAVGLDSSVSAVLIQNCMIIAGVGTLVQLYPVWRIGSRLPIVMGISFTFLSLAISIAAAKGMGVLMGAVIIGGLVEGIGYKKISCERSIIEEMWDEKEKLLYGNTPMFMIRAEKEEKA